MKETCGHETGSLSSYLDGGLGPEEAERIRRRLDECSDCRRLLDELRAVRERARSLEDRPPPRDLWPGVARRIQAAETGPGRGRGKVVLSRPELAAAAAILLSLGATLGWFGATARSGGGGAEGTARAALEMTGGAPSDRVPERTSLARLERSFRVASSGLSPERRATLERSLAIVDSALAEARRALRDSPRSPYLRRYTAQLERRKAGLLRLALRVSANR